jgi:hypothetical protein
MITKLQIAFGFVAGLALLLFFAGMVSNVNVARVPSWLSPLALGSLGLVVAACVGVGVTLVLDRERPPGSDEDEEDEEGEKAEAASDEVSETSKKAKSAEEDELLPTESPDLADLGQTEVDAAEAPLEFTEPGGEETIDFSTDE